MSKPTQHEWYTELIASLEALPVHRLIRCTLRFGEDWCAVGSVFRARGISIDGMCTDTYWDALRASREAICATSSTNDYLYNVSPEERWELMVAWAVEQEAKTRPRKAK